MDKFWRLMREEGIVRNMRWVFWIVLTAVLVIVMKWNYWSWDYWDDYYTQSNSLIIVFDFLALAVWPICVPILWGLCELYCIFVSPTGTSTERE
jgi:hypothetical protein